MRTLSTNNIFIPYSSNTTKHVPANGSMAPGEWAINVPDRLLFIGDAAGSPTTKIDLNKELPGYAGGNKNNVLAVDATGTGVEWVVSKLPGILQGGNLDPTTDPATTLTAITGATLYHVNVGGVVHANYHNIGGRTLAATDYIIRTMSDNWIVMSDLVDLRKDLDALLPADTVFTGTPTTLPNGGILANDGTGTLTWANPFPTNKKGQLQNDGSGVLSWEEDPNDHLLGEYSATKTYTTNQMVNFGGEIWTYKSAAVSTAGDAPGVIANQWEKFEPGGGVTVSPTAPTTKLKEGNLWFDSSATGGKTYIAIAQGTTFIWVETSKA